MASLKKIMNVDDDHVDIPPPLKRALEPDPRPPHGPETSFPSSRPSFHLTFTSSSSSTSSPLASHHRSPAPLPPYPQTARVGSSPTSGPSSSSLSVGSDLGFGRRRNASNDSMESYLGQHNYLPDRSVATQGSTMRPGLPSGAPGDAPVKLTPITGRVSKAKKGMPVHECDICQPPKHFTRAEHLRRHQLSHSPPDLVCGVSGCDKAFHREDLLRRHQQRHEAEHQLATQSQGIRLGSHDTSSMYGSTSYSTMANMGPMYGTSGPSSRPGSGPSATDSTWPSRSMAPGAPGMPSQDQYSLTSGLVGQPPASTLLPGYDQPRTSPSMIGSISSLHTPETTSTMRWSDTSAPPSSSSSVFSTPSDANRLTHLPARSLADEWVTSMTLAPTDTSTAGAYSTTMPFSYDSSLAGMGLPITEYHEDASLYGPRDFGNSTVRSLPPPHVPMAQLSETLVTAPSPLSTDRLIEPACQGWQQQGFKTMSDTTPVDSLSPPGLTLAARQAIPTYVNVYWEKVAPIYPIVHGTSLEVAVTIPEHRELLACAMAAVATQYLDSPDDRVNGSQLHAYAWNQAKTYTKSDPWPLPIVQTILLCEFYARCRGRKKGAHIASPHFARLYQMMNDHGNTFAAVPYDGSLEQRWRVWVDMETRRRILAACFLLDVHSMRYFEQPPTKVRGLDYGLQSTLFIPLPSTTIKRWDALRARDWGVALDEALPTKTLANISLEDITSQDIASVSHFDRAIILAGLSLQLPRRRSLTKVDLIKSPLETHLIVTRISTLFSDSGGANTYLALQHTPLHILLSVSGDSWVFNNKVPSQSSFEDHRQQLQEWRASATSTIATAFAARALKAFLTPCVRLTTRGGEPTVHPRWDDISDYWGFYVCILICWACGCDDAEADCPPFTLSAALQCVSSLSHLQPSQVRGFIGRNHARLLVGLGKRVLVKDCVGGRSILLADAVNVLRRLDERDGRKW